jgi:hypothetical protein
MLRTMLCLASALTLAACARSAPIADAGASAPAADAGAEAEAAPPALFDADIPREIAPNEPRPAGRVIRYPGVSMAEREGKVLPLVEDLVIEEQRGEREYGFLRATGLVVDQDGRLYVHDSGRYRVIVYAADGSFVGAFGGAGDMAPFRRGWIALAGGRLAISTGTKVTVWSRDGKHLHDRSLLRHAFDLDVQGTVDGALVGSFRALDRAGERWYSVEKRYLDSERSFTYWAVRVPGRGSTRPAARPGFAATRRGEVYLTRGDRYVVHAFDADGAARWILHVDERFGRAPDDADPPPPALSIPGASAGRGRGHPVRTDGHGNLYVFPYPGEGWRRDLVPVDVYSPDGERLFAGFTARVSWLRARGDAFYGIEEDEAADIQRIVRYRIQAPFIARGSR